MSGPSILTKSKRDTTVKKKQTPRGLLQNMRRIVNSYLVASNIIGTKLTKMVKGFLCVIVNPNRKESVDSAKQGSLKRCFETEKACSLNAEPALFALA